MCYINEPSFITASLLIISEILKIRSDVKISLFGINSKHQNADGQANHINLMDDDDEERFEDIDRLEENKIDNQVIQKNKSSKDT